MGSKGISERGRKGGVGDLRLRPILLRSDVGGPRTHLRWKLGKNDGGDALLQALHQRREGRKMTEAGAPFDFPEEDGGGVGLEVSRDF